MKRNIQIKSKEKDRNIIEKKIIKIINNKNYL
jgi:hypothetical protein